MGVGRHHPEMDSETRIQALRGAAGAKLHNVGNHDAGNPSASAMRWLSSSVRNWGRKCWVRRVPAAAVIPAAQVVVIIIGPKASVAGLLDAWVNRCAQRIELRVDRQAWDRERRELLEG